MRLRPLSVVSRPSSRVKRKREGIASWSACFLIAGVKRPYGAGGMDDRDGAAVEHLVARAANDLGVEDATFGVDA